MNRKEYINPAAPRIQECATIDNVKALFYNDFVAQFHTMTKSELDKFDLDYSYTHHKFLVMSNIYRLWIQKEFWSSKKYSLIHLCNPNKRLLKEGEVVSVSASIVIKSLTKGFIDKYGEEAKKMYAPEWCGCLKNAGYTCIKDIIHFFPLSPKQVGLNPTADYRVENFWVAVPDVKDNIKMLEQAASLYGYSLLTQQKDSNRSGTYDTDWVILTFAPDFQPYIDEEVYEENNYFYHISLQKNEKDILEHGIMPRSDNNTFHYPPRVYMMREKGSFTTYKEDEVELDTNTILNLSKVLVKSRLLGKPGKDEDYIYTVFRIKTSDIDEDINFSYDMDFYPLGIFTMSRIPPNVLYVVGHFDSREDEITDFEI